MKEKIFLSELATVKVMEGYKSLAAFLYKRGWGERWTPGKPLKLFLVNYSGQRNMGADMRVQEIVRQIDHLLGSKNCKMTAMTLNPKYTKGYFEPAEQKHVSFIYPLWILGAAHDFHGIVACEGSMFTSQFTNHLPIFLTGSMGLASAQKKLSLAYGIEAGNMPERLWTYCTAMAKDGLSICRNQKSKDLLDHRALRTSLGTDTAWTFTPLPPSYGRQKLLDAGWDGKKPILSIAAINPFCWPVYSSPLKGMARLLSGAFAEEHCVSWYFFSSSEERKKKWEFYLSSIAEGVKPFIKKHDVFPILIGTEKLDLPTVLKLKGKMGEIPSFTSYEYDMFQLVSILRESSFLLSSRFHAVVAATAKGIPTAGISMDSRIRNVLEARGHHHLVASVDDPHLGHKVSQMLDTLWEEKNEIKERLEQFIVQQLKVQGTMGITFCEELLKTYPSFPLERMPRNWEEALPPLNVELKHLLKKHG